MKTLFNRVNFPRWREKGFSLVEVSIAMGIAAISLLSVLGLLPIGSNNNRNAIEQTRAAGIARTIVSDLRSCGSGTSSLYNFVPATASGSTTFYLNEDCISPSSSLTGSSRYRATVVFSPVSNGVVGTRLLLSWPAAAAPANASGQYEVFTMLRVD